MHPLASEVTVLLRSLFICYLRKGQSVIRFYI